MTAQEIKQAIKDAGLTQAQVAEKMGVSLRAVQHWCGGTQSISKSNQKFLKIILAMI